MTKNTIALIKDGTIENVIVVPPDCTPDEPGRLRDLFAQHDSVAFASELDDVTIETERGPAKAKAGAGDKLERTPIGAVRVETSAVFEAATRAALEELEAAAADTEPFDPAPDDVPLDD